MAAQFDLLALVGKRHWLAHVPVKLIARDEALLQGIRLYLCLVICVRGEGESSKDDGQDGEK